MCDTARRYPLSEVHAFICKNASKIDHWLPKAVRESLQELEKVVSDNAATTQLNVYGHRNGGSNWRGGSRVNRGHHDSGSKREAPQWKNDNWNNFRTFKATKVISTKTPTTKFRTLFNKLTEGKLKDTIGQVSDLLQEVLDEKELDNMANVILDFAKASPGNADLYAAFLRGLQIAGSGGLHETPKTRILATVAIDKLRASCVANTTKVAHHEDDSYDAMCAANATNDGNTTYLKLAVLCEKHGVLTAGSTALLLKRLGKKLTRLGTKVEDKGTAEVLTSRLVAVLEATGVGPIPEVRTAIDTVLEHCRKRADYPGLKNKVQFTLMDYLDTLDA